MVRSLSILCLAGLSLSLATPAHALGFRVGQIPNGDVFSCALCHTAGGGSPRNDFGLDVEAVTDPGGDVDWSLVFDLDSDGDGLTNGEEMGDPDGDGTAEPNAEVSDPSDPDDPGDGSDDGGVGGDDGGDDDDEDADDEDGGGCSTAPAPASSMLALTLLGGLLAGRRRRR